MAHQSNLAASLGSWSARHRIAAITGWLLLVIVTMLIGSAVGQATMTQAAAARRAVSGAQGIFPDFTVGFHLPPATPRMPVIPHRAARTRITPALQ